MMKEKGPRRVFSVLFVPRERTIRINLIIGGRSRSATVHGGRTTRRDRLFHWRPSIGRTLGTADFQARQGRRYGWPGAPRGRDLRDRASPGQRLQGFVDEARRWRPEDGEAGPMTRDRDGFVMGRGPVIGVLEEYGARQGPGARNLCRGQGLRSLGHAYHITAPS